MLDLKVRKLKVDDGRVEGENEREGNGIESNVLQSQQFHVIKSVSMRDLMWSCGRRYFLLTKHVVVLYVVWPRTKFSII